MQESVEIITCGICCQMLCDCADVGSIERWGAFSGVNEAAVRCCWRAVKRRCTAPCPSISSKLGI